MAARRKASCILVRINCLHVARAESLTALARWGNVSVLVVSCFPPGPLRGTGLSFGGEVMRPPLTGDRSHRVKPRFNFTPAVSDGMPGNLDMRQAASVSPKAKGTGFNGQQGGSLFVGQNFA